MHHTNKESTSERFWLPCSGGPLPLEAPEIHLGRCLEAHGFSGQDGLDRAVQIVQEFGGPWALLDADHQRLQGTQCPGVNLAGLMEAARFGLSVLAQPSPLPVLSCSSDVFRLMSFMGRGPRETFWVLGLDNKNRLLFKEQVAEGSGNICVIDPKEVFVPLLRRSAIRAIFAHNHPSGDPSPSIDDIRLTQRLVDAGSLLGVAVLDHVVIGRGSFVSIMDIPPEHAGGTR